MSLVKSSSTEGAAFVALLAMVWAIAVGTAEAAYPAVRSMSPNGVQRGQEFTITFDGDRLADAEDILFYEPGFTLKEVVSAGSKKFVAKIVVAPDAALGIHRYRIRSRTGVSDMKLFSVGRFTQIAETEPNTAFDEAQKVDFNRTIEGLVSAEDIDYYRVSAKKGQRISIEIEGWRLGNTLFDPYVAILNKDRFEVASSDDSALLQQDGHCTYIAEADGDYTIMIRESAYRGNGASRYRAHIGDFVRPTFLYPLGGKAGQEREFTFFDESTGELGKQKIRLPDAEIDRHPVESQLGGGAPAPSPNYLRVSAFDDLMEEEPTNDNRNSGTLIPSIPYAANGIIQKDNDRDYYKLAMKKDQTINASVYGARLNSPIDSLLNVYDAKGKNLKSADDVARNPDARFAFKAPADGDYFFLVRDRLELGSPTKAYRLEFTRPESSLVISFPDNQNNRSHHRQFIAVARGDRFAALANIRRVAANGDVDIHFPKLPAGVRLLTTKIPADQGSSFPLVFEAAADAPLGGVLSPFEVATVGEKPVRGGMRQSFDFIKGPPGNTVYYDSTVKQLPIVVTEEAPYKLRFEKPAPLCQYGNIGLKVIADRKEGFDEVITLFTLWKPGNVTGPVTIQIPKGKSEVSIPYNAKSAAKPGSYQVAIVGEGNSGGTTFSSTGLIPMEIVGLFLSGKFAMTTVEQGKEVAVKVALEQKRDFAGEAKATLYGLPTKCTAEPVMVTKDTKELVFTVKIDPKTPPTTYKNLFARIEVNEGGGTLTHQVGAGGVIRVDKPRPPKPDVEVPKKTPTPTSTAPTSKPVAAAK